MQIILRDDSYLRKASLQEAIKVVSPCNNDIHVKIGVYMFTLNYKSNFSFLNRSVTIVCQK